MKGNEQKMPRMGDILNLPVQDPPCAEFSAANINWVKVEGGRQGGDDVALIPFSRVDDFVKGESTNDECPANFRIESRRKRNEGSVSKPRVDGYLEYTLYWCSYGPEDYRDSEPGFGEISNHKPPSGKGSRPGRRHMMRGCLCHFTVKRLYTRPHLALINYNQRSHVDKTGAPCHGILDRDALGTRGMYAPRISEKLRQKVMSMLYVGIPLDDIIQHHTEEVERHGGPSNRDDFLTRNDVRNMERMMRQTTHELHESDDHNIKMWVHRHQKHVFFFRDTTTKSFVLGIQTEWQLQQMLRYGHNSSVATHSAFGLKKFKYPLCTLLVFDSNQNAIPVAWVITSSFNGQDIHCWAGALVQRIRAKDPSWKPTSFLMDDPYFDISVIRDTFQCRVVLCLWHVRRSWVKNLLRKCSNFIVQQEMIKIMGRILYCTRDGPSAIYALEEFMQVFVDQSTFMEYFKDCWLPRIDMWANATRILQVGNQELSAAVESYHLNLKSKLFGDPNAGSSMRVDWLVHTLTTKFHSLYWLAQYTEASGYFRNLKEASFSTNSWYRGLHIPDIDVILDGEDLSLARVVSQSNRNLAYTIWNPGSELSLCDCSWSRSGNLCKHVIKVCMLCRNRQVGRPSSIASQTYRQVILNLLNNPPDDPIVLNNVISQVTHIQQEVNLSNSGLLQPLPPVETNHHVADSLLPLARLH